MRLHVQELQPIASVVEASPQTARKPYTIHRLAAADRPCVSRLLCFAKVLGLGSPGVAYPRIREASDCERDF
jgi:hypothetical protein